MAVVGLFAVFHGHAHGAEMPSDASGASYAAGFMLATALLHGAGLLLGLAVGLAGRVWGDRVFRVVGGFASLAGIALLVGAL
jgi:urease accessory protein